MRIYLFFIIFFVSKTGFCQSNIAQKWQPLIIDKNTKTPLSGATISVNKKEYYPVADNGLAEIPLTKLTKLDTIYVSSIGYKTLKIFVEKIANLPLKLDLEPYVFQLETVEIKRNTTAKELMVGADETAKIGHAFIPINTHHALYINNLDKQKGYIKEVYIRMNNFAGAIKMPFKLTLFDKLENSIFPNQPIMDEIITQNTSNKKWFKINLSYLNIKIPENGFFIVFSILPQQYYSNKKYNAGVFLQDKVPGLDYTLRQNDMIKANYSLRMSSNLGWRIVKNTEFQMQAKLLITDD